MKSDFDPDRSVKVPPRREFIERNAKYAKIDV